MPVSRKGYTLSATAILALVLAACGTISQNSAANIPTALASPVTTAPASGPTSSDLAAVDATLTHLVAIAKDTTTEGESAEADISLGNFVPARLVDSFAQSCTNEVPGPGSLDRSLAMRIVVQITPTAGYSGPVSMDIKTDSMPISLIQISPRQACNSDRFAYASVSNGQNTRFVGWLIFGNVITPAHPNGTDSPLIETARLINPRLQLLHSNGNDVRKLTGSNVCHDPTRYSYVYVNRRPADCHQ